MDHARTLRAKSQRKKNRFQIRSESETATPPDRLQRRGGLVVRCNARPAAHVVLVPIMEPHWPVAAGRSPVRCSGQEKNDEDPSPMTTHAASPHVLTAPNPGRSPVYVHPSCLNRETRSRCWH
jgi:hypothetical protein